MINTAMDSDAGGSDTVASTVSEAVAIAMAHHAELAADTHSQGSTIGDHLSLPGAPDVDSTILGG